jgi:HEAT repeat protein
MSSGGTDAFTITPRRRLRYELKRSTTADIEVHLPRLARIIPDLAEELCAALADPSEDELVRYSACAALGRVSDERAIPALLLAGATLGTLATAEALSHHGDRAASLALEWLRGAAVERRVAAALYYSKRDDARSIRYLLKLVDAPEAECRRAACWALTRQQPPQVRELLIRLLCGDSSARVRATAAEALGLLGDHRSASILGAASTRDLIPSVRASARFGLAVLGK